MEQPLGLALTNVPPCELHGGIPVDVGEQPEAEALRVGGVGEAVHRHGGLRGVECLPDTLVQLVVGDGAPEGWLAVGDGLQVWETGQAAGQWGPQAPASPRGPPDAPGDCFSTSQRALSPQPSCLLLSCRIPWATIHRCWETCPTSPFSFSSQGPVLPGLAWPWGEAVFKEVLGSVRSLHRHGHLPAFLPRPLSNPGGPLPAKGFLPLALPALGQTLACQAAAAQPGS